MTYNPDIHQRKSIRLKNYDYSKEGLYFITICTENKEKLFGEIVNNNITLNNAGQMIEKIWFEIPKFYKGFKLHEFIVMPNHIHGIIEIIEKVGDDSHISPIIINNNSHISPDSTASLTGKIQRTHNVSNQQGEYRDSPLPRKQISISELIQRFKILTTNNYIKMVKNNELPSFNKRVWQRNYYENIIKNEKRYLQVIEYIKNNPLKWEEDKYFL